MEWLEKNTLRWFGHLEKKKIKEFVKKVYVHKIVGPRRRERPVVRWKDKVKEYIHELCAGREVGFWKAKSVLIGRGGGLFWRDHPFLEGMRHQTIDK